MTAIPMQQTAGDAIDLDTLDFFDPGVLENPYAVLKRLRAERPVMKFRQRGFERDWYVVSSHELVTRVLLDNATFSSRTKEIFTGGGKRDPRAEAIYATTWPEVESMLTSDEPDHTRLRALAQAAFMPARIRRMADIIAETITTLIDRFADKGECDFVREFAVPLPIHTIGRILGIAPEYYDRMYDWTFSIIRRDGQMATPDEEVVDARNVVEMKRHVEDLVRERRARPRDDLISDLVTARIDGAPALTDLEIMSTIVILIIGGSETTRSTLISALPRLIANPDQLALLRADPTLAPRAIDEILRMDSPGAALWRRATREVELGGVRIPEGGIVLVRIDSANRDERVFDEPERFDIRRDNERLHAAFGKGIHHCIGFRLAREQLGQSIPALLARLQDLRLVPDKCDLRAFPAVHVRCLRAVSLAFTPAARGRA